MQNILTVKNLQVSFKTEKGKIKPVENVSFSLKPGETIGIVGESGSGKSITSLSIMDLLAKNGRIEQGSVQLNQRELTSLPADEIRRLRGNEMSMIFQEPMTSLNPVLTIGNQLIEQIRLYKTKNKSEAKKYAIKMLQRVGIPNAGKIIDDYPHLLSGGMRQRVMIAMALSCEPKVLIADEPTTALDVTIQAQILTLMKQLKKDLNTSIILITHDLGVVAEMADKVAVMYAGEIVEEADVFTLFDHPQHPYTKALLESIPHIDGKINERLSSIKGKVPSFDNMPKGCRFSSRCPFVTEKCRNEHPFLVKVGASQRARCWLVEEDLEKRGIQVDR